MVLQTFILILLKFGKSYNILFTKFPSFVPKVCLDLRTFLQISVLHFADNHGNIFSEMFLFKNVSGFLHSVEKLQQQYSRVI